MQRFGEKLRALRLQRRLTTRALAEALGFTVHSNNYISRIETGKQTPSLKFVLRAADFFQVPVDMLTRDDVDLDLDDSTADGDETP
jgi:transcriptional regulator with XRE-family HTH domain